MNLRIFFDSIKEEIVNGLFEPNSLRNYIKINFEDFPNYKDIQIAIIGVVEERGSENNKGLIGGPDEIRKKLYGLLKGTGDWKIGDLGNLRNGISASDTYLRLKEVCEILMQNNVLPLIIGGSQDMDFGQFLAYENSNKLINLLNVDAFIDMLSTEEYPMSRKHIHKILIHESNMIFHYAHLAYQSYLMDPESINVLEKLHFETFRIGMMRENFADMEPVIRNADMLTFDLTSIRMSDAPGNANAQPFGLTGEEACQLCWYAGLNEKLTSAGFYEYNPTLDNRGQTAGVVATMLWYFIEGYYHRRNVFNINNPEFVKYTVSLMHEPHKIVFYKNSRSEKWWMEVPYPENKAKYSRSSIVPCSYSDYLAASKGEVPFRWILTHSKLI